jgi:hypothetical protein
MPFYSAENHGKRSRFTSIGGEDEGLKKGKRDAYLTKKKEILPGIAKYINTVKPMSIRKKGRGSIDPQAPRKGPQQPMRLSVLFYLLRDTLWKDPFYIKERLP